ASGGAELAQPGQRVRVMGQTQLNNTILATQIGKPDSSDEVDHEEISLTPTLTTTESFTASPTFTATLTATPPLTSTATSTPSATPTATVTPAITTTGCVAVQPAGWVTYSVQSGDTLSGLAAPTGSTLAQLISVNCLENPRLLVSGQQLYLPM